MNLDPEKYPRLHKARNFFLEHWLRYCGVTLILAFSVFWVNIAFERDNAGGGISELISRLEEQFFDWRTKYQYLHNKIDSDVVVLAIDADSLTKIGRWPWSRKILAEATDRLRALNAKVVAFDIILAEPETTDPTADDKLAAAITKFTSEQNRAIIFPIITNFSSAETESSTDYSGLPDELDFSVANSSNISLVSSLSKSDLPLQKFLAAGALVGSINSESDIDGVFRRFPVISYTPLGPGPEDDKSFYSFSIQALTNYGLPANTAPGTNAVSAYTVKFYEKENSVSLRLEYTNKGENRDYPISKTNSTLRVRFFGGENNFVNVPMHRLLSDAPADREFVKDKFANKIVIIGSTAIGAHDLRNTPVSSTLPGLYVHANIIHMLKNNFYFASPEESKTTTFAILLLGTLLIISGYRFQSPIIDFLLTAATMVTAYLLDRYLLLGDGTNDAQEVKLVACFFTFASIYVWFTFLNVYREAKEKRKIKGTFSRYVAPSVVKQMLANPEKLKVGGEKKEITMMFSDVRDFTTISEKLTPQDLSTLLNLYMGKMTDILFETYGTLDKYIGDALVGFWGAPVDVPDHAYHAVRAAKQMVEALPAINEDFQKRNYPQISVGLGLNTGEVSVGNMGSDKIFQYTALGDNMNLASRLEGLTKYYGVQIMISEYTYEKLGDHRQEFQMRPLDMVQVKGKTLPVKIYEVIPAQHPLAKDPASLASYQKAYALYLEQKFSEAKEIFSEITQRYSEDKASKKLLEACKEFLQNPPPADWRGVSVFTTK